MHESYASFLAKIPAPDPLCTQGCIFAHTVQTALGRYKSVSSNARVCVCSTHSIVMYALALQALQHPGGQFTHWFLVVGLRFLCRYPTRLCHPDCTTCQFAVHRPQRDGSIHHHIDKWHRWVVPSARIAHLHSVYTATVLVDCHPDLMHPVQEPPTGYNDKPAAQMGNHPSGWCWCSNIVPLFGAELGSGLACQDANPA